MTICGTLGFFAACVGGGNLFLLDGAHGFSSLAINSTGSYTFTQYGPLGGMLVLTYSGGVEGGSVSYLQTTFTGQGTGSFVVTFYDASADPPVTSSGNFTVQ